MYHFKKLGLSCLGERNAYPDKASLFLIILITYPTVWIMNTSMYTTSLLTVLLLHDCLYNGHLRSPETALS